MQLFRLDRLLSLRLFHPQQRVGLGAAEFRLPILMYHSISDHPEKAVSAYYQTATNPGIFAQHMAALRAGGFDAINLKMGLDMLRGERAVTGRPVVLTFDDGFRDFHVAAFPTLQQYGFSATVFLPTAFIREDRRSFKGKECLTWSEVRELHREGVEFGSHTVNHPELHELDPAQIRMELEQSKAAIENELGETIGSFAYPYAFPGTDLAFVSAFKDLVTAAGYGCCATTTLGRVKIGDDPYCLKRLPANSLDDPALFRAKLEGGYDWLAGPQAAMQRFRLRFLHSGHTHTANSLVPEATLN